MFSRSFKGVGLHYTAFRDALREDSRQTTPSRGVTPRKKFAAEANVESRVKSFMPRLRELLQDGDESAAEIGDDDVSTDVKDRKHAFELKKVEVEVEVDI